MDNNQQLEPQSYDGSQPVYTPQQQAAPTMPATPGGTPYILSLRRAITWVEAVRAS